MNVDYLKTSQLGYILRHGTSTKGIGSKKRKSNNKR